MRQQQERTEVESALSDGELAVVVGTSLLKRMSAEDTASHLLTQGIRALYLSLTPEQKQAVLRRLSQ